MKNVAVYIIMACTILTGSCQKEDEADTEKGLLNINVGLFLNVSEVENQLKSASDAYTAPDDFPVAIYDISNHLILEFNKASDIPDEVSLDAGQYYVTAHSNNNLPAAFDNPYYYGKSEIFKIDPGRTQSITVNCTLANTIVAVIYTQSLKDHYSDYTATVSTSAGSLVYNKDETRMGYFQPLPIEITVKLKYQDNDGAIQEKTIAGVIPTPEARKKYEVKIESSEVRGKGSFGIVVDESTVPVETVTITDNDLAVSGVYKSGELLITEIMYDPAGVPDANGEWFEIYNNTNHDADLYQVVIRKNSTESHIINSSVLLAPHQYFVCARSADAVSVEKYNYGTSISLTNTGASLSLYNYGTNGSDGSQICLVNYGANGFPSGTGVSICLSPDLLSASYIASGSSWCNSSSTYNTGDKGTPGAPNDACKNP
jgi:hypothetical protein